MQLLPCYLLAREQRTVILTSTRAGRGRFKCFCLDSFIRLFQGLGINILVFELAVKQSVTKGA